MEMGHGGNPLAYLDPGPKDRSVLTLHPNHRSELIWADPATPLLSFKLSTHYLWNFGTLHPRVITLLQYTGFYGLFKGGDIKVDKHLINALAERWRQETHTFHLPVGEATVTLQDVAVIWGLPIIGLPLISNGATRKVEEWQELCLELLGYQPEATEIKNGQLNLVSLNNHLLEFLPVHDDSTDEVVVQHTRGRIMQLIAMLFSDKSASGAKLMYLPFLGNVHAIRNYSWGSAILALLYRNLCWATRMATKEIGGPQLLLQLWVWERIPKLTPTVRPTVTAQNFEDLAPLPRGAAWNKRCSFVNVGSHLIYLFRDQLDHLVEGDFIWNPYEEDELMKLPDYCLTGRDIWRSHVPLINFCMVKLHAPERVMLQFGFEQGIPPDIDTGERLHSLDFRGRNTEKWAIKHRDHIALWEQVDRSVIVGNISNASIDYFSPYMTWYRNITRLLVGNPAKPPDRAIRPYGALTEYYNQSMESMYHVVGEMLDNLHLEGYPMEDKLVYVHDQINATLTCSGEGNRLVDGSSSASTQGGSMRGRSTHEHKLGSTQSRHRSSTSRHREGGEDGSQNSGDDWSYHQTSHHEHGTPDSNTFEAFARHSTSSRPVRGTHDKLHKRRKPHNEFGEEARTLSMRSEPTTDTHAHPPQGQHPPHRPRRHTRPPPCGT